MSLGFEEYEAMIEVIIKKQNKQREKMYRRQLEITLAELKSVKNKDEFIKAEIKRIKKELK